MTSTSASNPQRLDSNSDKTSVAAWIAHLLKERSVNRVYGLQGGHIQPLWDHVAQEGIQIIDVRDERAAVHMAHAHSELTGCLGVALATAGPGVTNTVTAIANAYLSRIPVLLIGGCPTTMQANMGGLQEISHTEIMQPITRYSNTARVADQAIRELNNAIARANGDAGEPGPAYIEIPPDVLRQTVSPNLILEDWLKPTPPRRLLPDPERVTDAIAVIRAAKRPLVISGRGARKASESLPRFLVAVDALYLDTQESRGLIPADHVSVVGAVRGAAMAQADLVITLGRKLDYQLGFGSPAAFPNARFLRIADNASELIDNRRGSPEILADVALTLDAIVHELGDDQGTRDTNWLDALRHKHRERIARGQKSAPPALGADGKIHPMAIFEAIKEVADPDYIGIADGGDLLSFARIGLQARTYM
ncbi:MAG: thiamine pyrophosphate-binding protein, partial [Gammaproteobacteria bacterium]|nr:thiamine pyrophosphate-binding protein [Gammaproteobacteria bacterium]